MAFTKNRGRANNGAKLASINFDQRTADRLTWMQQVCEQLLDSKATLSVMVRASVAYYAAHLESILKKKPDSDAIERERWRVKLASDGKSEPLPEEQLKATPPRPLSKIEREAFEARQAMLKARILGDSYE
jgi:hypothetical protein